MALWTVRTLSLTALQPGFFSSRFMAGRGASDLARGDRVELDLEGPEVLLPVHKGGKSARRKNQLLPVLVQGIGIDGEVWPLTLQDLFNAVGLKCVGTQADLFSDRPSALEVMQEPWSSGRRRCQSFSTSSRGMLSQAEAV